MVPKDFSSQPPNMVTGVKSAKHAVTIEDSNLIASLQYMKSNNLLGIDNSTQNFDSIKEAEDYSKENVISAVKEEVNNLKQDISDLQKKGYELHLEGIKLLTIPLKLKVWQSNSLKKDLEAIFEKMNSVKPLIEQYKKDLEEKTFEKEQQEKEKETKEKLLEKEKKYALTKQL